MSTEQEKMDAVRKAIRREVKADPALALIDSKIDINAISRDESPTAALNAEERKYYFRGKLKPLFQELMSLNADLLRKKLVEKK